MWLHPSSTIMRCPPAWFRPSGPITLCPPALLRPSNPMGHQPIMQCPLNLVIHTISMSRVTPAIQPSHDVLQIWSSVTKWLPDAALITLKPHTDNLRVRKTYLLTDLISIGYRRHINISICAENHISARLYIKTINLQVIEPSMWLVHNAITVTCAGLVLPAHCCHTQSQQSSLSFGMSCGWVGVEEDIVDGCPEGRPVVWDVGPVQGLV